jgi:hypothetical protein
LPEDINVPAALKAIGTGDCRKVKTAGFANPLELVGSTIRPVLVAAPGHRFVGGDLKGIEARVCASLAGEQWKVAAFGIEHRGNSSDLATRRGDACRPDPLPARR